MDPETHRNPRLVRPSKPNGAAKRTFARYANWTVGLAAAALVLISAGGYFQHREQLAAIATEHLRLIVTGPSSIQAGVVAEYMVSTTAIDGQALPAEIEVALLNPNGERIKAFRETADENGRLKVVIPADAKLPSRVMLKVAARHHGNLEEAEAELAVDPDTIVNIGRTAVEIDHGSSPETPEKTLPIDLGRIDVTFHPEGGNLVAELKNRVYFVALNSSGEPVRLSGIIVEDGGPRRSVVSVETTVDGLGVFSFVPHAGKNYRLKITDPPNAIDEPQLPEPSTELQASLTAGVGVFDAAAPLVFHVRSSEAGRPLIAVAYAQGAQVGQQPMLSAANRATGQPVQIELDDAVGGEIQLILYDYGVTPPKRLAERIVYRRPGRKLNVRLIGTDRQYAPGESVELSLLVTDERGRPVPAALGVAVAVLSTNQIKRNARLDQEESPAKVDLLLCTREWRRFGERPPMMHDNIERIKSNYENSLAEYQADRTGVLNTLTAASFFGGLGLVLLVAMLGLMRIVSGIHLWVSAIGATTCCMILGAILMDPTRPSPGPDAVAAFASYHAPVAEGESQVAVGPPLGESSDFAETIFWRSLLIADRDGKATVRFDLPETPAIFEVWIDARGAGLIGVGRATIVSRNP